VPTTKLLELWTNPEPSLPAPLRRLLTLLDVALLLLGACFLAQPTRDRAMRSAGFPGTEPEADARPIVGRAVLAGVPFGSTPGTVIGFLERRGFDPDESSGRSYALGANPSAGDTAILATLRYRGSSFYRDFLSRCHEIQIRFHFEASKGTARLRSISVRDGRSCFSANRHRRRTPTGARPSTGAE
jgi:hypothetical protein